MRLTLISDFQSKPDLLAAFSLALRGRQKSGGPLSFWLREKQTASDELPIAELQSLAAEHEFRLETSWAHRRVAGLMPLHIPDRETARNKSRAFQGRRILSAHSLQQAELLLLENPSDEVLVSAWREAISKQSSGATLNHAATLALARRFENRLHIVSGLRAEDYAKLKDEPLASLAFCGSFTAEPKAFLKRLGYL
jgi:hypothetical protein